MRMWNIPTPILCDVHAKAEHYETHIIAASIKKSLLEIGDISNSMKGLRRNGRFDVRLLQSRHDELEVDLNRRGIKAKTPLIVDFSLEDSGQVDIVISVQDLADRCIECRVNILKSQFRVFTQQFWAWYQAEGHTSLVNVDDSFFRQYEQIFHELNISSRVIRNAGPTADIKIH